MQRAASPSGKVRFGAGSRKNRCTAPETEPRLRLLGESVQNTLAIGKSELEKVAVRRWNPLGRIVIHTIGLGMHDGAGGGGGRGGRGRPGGGGMGGGAGARGFLQQLAKQNDGKYVEPK